MTRVGESSGSRVEYLEYEAYRPTADKKLEEIAAEIRDRWEVGHVSMVHRFGSVDPGEASVVIMVASPRRGAAFEANRYATERIEEVVPIWKREVRSDGYVPTAANSVSRFKGFNLRASPIRLSRRLPA